MRTDLLFDQFDTLLTTPDDVAHLRAAIFQLAVQGELVLQDPADEPATQLLKHIQVDREQLIRKKKIRKTEALPPIEDNETTYALPKNWVWVRLSEIGLINPRNEVDDNVEASFVPMRLIPTEYGEAHTSEKRLWGEIRSGYTHFQENDVVVAKITPCFRNRKSVVMRDLINDSTEKRSSVPRWWDARALSCSLFIARSPNLGCFWRQSGTLAPSA